MKKLFFLFFVLTAATFAQQQNPISTSLKIGYVDSEVILAQYPEAIKAKSDLDGLVAKWRKDIDSLSQDFEKDYTAFQGKQATMKEDEKQKAQKSLLEKQQRAQVFQQSKFNQPNGEYFVKQDQLMKPVKEKIFKAIDDISKEEAMQFVFDKAGDVILLKADPQYDITFKVLDLLKRGKK